MDLLKQLVEVHAPSGREEKLRDFIIQYVEQNQHSWQIKPEIHYGKGFQNCLALVFGKPKTAVFAHMDSIGFIVSYHDELVKLGKPKAQNGFKLVGKDSRGFIECELIVDDEKITYAAERSIDLGTTLTFEPDFREHEDFIQSPYMDNRLGVYNALKLAETLKNGILCFSCWEEHGGGSVSYLTRFIYENYGVEQALISDITWATEGIHHGKGTAISVKDSGIPRRAFVDKIIDLASKSNIYYQLEVESAGGSDGNEVQRTPYPIDWCFVGAPENYVHSPNEKVHKDDIQSMLTMYAYLMEKLD